MATKAKQNSVTVCEAIALAALTAWAKRDSKRKAIREGRTHQVAFQVMGTVDGKTVKFQVAGELSIGKTNPTGSTSKPDLVEMVANVLGAVPKARRADLIIDLAKRSLEPSDEDLQMVESLVIKLSKKGPRAGAIEFKPAE